MAEVTVCVQLLV